MVNKLIQNAGAPKTGLMSNSLPTCKDLPPPLDWKDYPHVCFWTAKAFEAYCETLIGETDGLATQQKKHGRRPKTEINEDQHAYLETVDGSAIPPEILVKLGQKAQRVWQALNNLGLAPSSWGKASENVYTYFNS